MVGRSYLQRTGLCWADAWLLEELTESSVGSLESEEDGELSEAGEGWTLVGCGRC